MTAVPDRIAAIVQYLKADSDVTALVRRQRGNALGPPLIFADELPDSLVGQMPTACIVVRDAPGGGAIHPRSYMQHSDSMVDIRHYGWTFSSARTLARVTINSLKQLGNARSGYINGTLIHWANPAGSPIPLRDFPLPAHSGEPPDRERFWPFYVQSWHVYAADVMAPA